MVFFKMVGGGGQRFSSERISFNFSTFLYKQFSSTGPTPAPRSNVGGSVAGGAIPDDKTLQKIAVKVYNKDWARLANKLDFEFEDIEEFKSQNNDKRSQVRNDMKFWVLCCF